MGRKKIAIEKLETASQRSATFKKRVSGIQKKAKELSILSDAQLLLLLQSPAGNYDLYVGESSTFDDVVQRYLSERQENRDKTELGTIQVLQNAFKKDDHMLKYEILMNNGTCPKKKKVFQEMKLAYIKEKISKLESRLGPLRNIKEIDKIESFDESTAMKNSIRELLAKNEQAKAQFIEKQRSLSGDFMIPYKRDLRCSTSTAVPAPTDPYMCAMNQHVTLMSHSTIPYQGVNPVPVTYTSGMDQPVVSMADYTTSPYQSVSMGSTSTAEPTPSYPCMGGMEQQARVEPICNALFNSGNTMSSTTGADSHSDILDQRVDQDAVLMPTLCPFLNRQEELLLPTLSSPCERERELTGSSTMMSDSQIGEMINEYLQSNN